MSLAPTTLELLRDWHNGNDQALDALIRRHLDWIRDYVHRRLGDHLRRRDDTQDMVQEAVIDVLQYGPRFEIGDEVCFRGLLARIVENNIRDRDRWNKRECRDPAREKSRLSDSILALDPAAGSVTQPIQQAARAETAEWIRLALELLEPTDRDVVLLRQWEGLGWQEICQRLGTSPNAARMRFERALPKLAGKVAELRGGRVREMLGG